MVRIEVVMEKLMVRVYAVVITVRDGMVVVVVMVSVTMSDVVVAVRTRCGEDMVMMKLW